jgi:hypothetical protein
MLTYVNVFYAFEPAGFPAAFAAYSAGRGYSGYASFGLPYPTGNLTSSLQHLLFPYPLDPLGLYNMHVATLPL